MKKLSILVCTLALLWASGPAHAEKWQVDSAHSSLSFTVEHLGLTEIDGRFTDFEGTINWDPKAPEKTTVSFTAEAKSINTDVPKRDDHLRSADFFDVEKYPTLSFKSSKVTHLSGDRYQVEGELSIHGVTKTVTTTAHLKGPKEAMGSQRIGFRAPFKINRLDYKVGEGQFSSASVIGHEVFIEVKGEAIPAR